MRGMTLFSNKNKWDWLSHGDVGFIHGGNQNLRSYLAREMALKLASGTHFLSYDAHESSDILIVCQTDSSNLRRRIASQAQSLGVAERHIKKLSFLAITESPKPFCEHLKSITRSSPICMIIMDFPQNIREESSEIEEALNELATSGMRPAVISTESCPSWRTWSLEISQTKDRSALIKNAEKSTENIWKIPEEII